MSCYIRVSAELFESIVNSTNVDNPIMSISTSLELCVKGAFKPSLSFNECTVSSFDQHKGTKVNWIEERQHYSSWGTVRVMYKGFYLIKLSSTGSSWQIFKQSTVSEVLHFNLLLLI